MTSGTSRAAPIVERQNVVCLIPEEARLSIALTALRRRAEVVACRCIDEFRDACVRVQPLSGVVVALRDAERTPTVGVVRALKALQPSVVVIVFCGTARGDTALLVDLLRDGADMLVREGIDDLVTVVDLALSQRTSPDDQTLIRRVAQQLGPSFDVSEAFVRCALLDRGITHATKVARAIGVSRRTLSSRFRRHGLPTPALLLMRLRLLYAVYVISEQRQPPREAMAASQFASVPAMRAALRRHCGMSIAEAKLPSATGILLAKLSARSDRIVTGQ